MSMSHWIRAVGTLIFKKICLRSSREILLGRYHCFHVCRKSKKEKIRFDPKKACKILPLIWLLPFYAYLYMVNCGISPLTTVEQFQKYILVYEHCVFARWDLNPRPSGPEPRSLSLSRRSSNLIRLCGFHQCITHDINSISYYLLQ